MHAVLQFQNPCVGQLVYEGTVMAIMMAGAFISFLVDFAGVQYLRRYHEHHGARLGDGRRQARAVVVRRARQVGNMDKMDTIVEEIEEMPTVRRLETNELMAMRRNRVDEEKLSVFIMEGGIIFHSIREFGFLEGMCNPTNGGNSGGRSFDRHAGR
jgi:zinc transporter 1/2/3